MENDGTMAKISEKWFGKDLTSNIDTKLQMLQ
jgi:ABC-type amino acid transport substrate-binding protein